MPFMKIPFLLVVFFLLMSGEEIDTATTPTPSHKTTRPPSTCSPMPLRESGSTNPPSPAPPNSTFND
jgi:hypothetical protein